MDVYVMDFEKLYNKTKKFKMELPEAVRAFKLLDGAGLDQKDRQLVLTGVDYKQTDALFKQMGSALKKFFGKQFLAKETISQSVIKVEPAYVADSYNKTDPSQEALFTRGYSQRGFNGARRWNFNTQNVQQSGYR